MTYPEFAKAHPISQAFHTGRYGWERISDCLNLARCVYSSPQQAGKARKAAFDALDDIAAVRDH